MLRTAAIAAVLAISAAVPATAQGYYAYGPTPGYVGAPPPPAYWRHRDRAEYRHEVHRAQWRCNHGDWRSCHWLRQHGRG